MKTDTKVLVLVMNYGTADEIISYANAISCQSVQNKICLMIVDNKYDANENLCERLTSIDLDIIYYNPEKNLGYLNGALFGIDYFKKLRGFVPDWLVVSNTDIEYDNNNFYENFLKRSYSEDTWCVAPSVLGANGRYCNPHYKERIPVSKVNRLIMIFKHSLLAKIYYKLASIKSDKNAVAVKQESQNVYSSHGCFFILKKNFYEALNGEKYGVLLYSEESFIAEFILENKKLSYYDSTIEVIHNENLVTGKINYKKRGKFISESMKYIKERFYDKQ